MTLHNSSVFPLRYTLEPLDDVHANFNNQSPFSCIPSEADIQPGKDLEVAIKFQPDHERPWLFHQNLRVQVPNQVKEHTIFLSGRCHARQMYAVGNDLDSDAARQIPESMEDPFMVSGGCIVEDEQVVICLYVSLRGLWRLEDGGGWGEAGKGQPIWLSRAPCPCPCPMPTQ